MTTTSEERVVQTQPQFHCFIEVLPFEGLIMREGQYFAQDPISGVFAILDHEVPKSKVIRPASISSTAPVVVLSTAKAVPTQQDPQFHTPDRDEWDSEETAVFVFIVYRYSRGALLLSHCPGAYMTNITLLVLKICMSLPVH